MLEYNPLEKITLVVRVWMVWYNHCAEAMVTLKAHFDGRVFVPDEVVSLAKDTDVTLTVIPVPPSGARREDGQALEAFIGRFETGLQDLAQRHDDYLADEYSDTHES